jgi:hypothetical protein
MATDADEMRFGTGVSREMRWNVLKLDATGRGLLFFYFKWGAKLQSLTYRRMRENFQQEIILLILFVHKFVDYN